MFINQHLITDKQLNNVTVSSTDKFPSELRNKRSAVQTDKKLASTDTWSKIDIVCRECQAKEVRYTSLQLRGADEGSTMFYYCPACSARLVQLSSQGLSWDVYME